LPPLTVAGLTAAAQSILKYSVMFLISFTVKVIGFPQW
jgi:hypothetical protein